ncbi:MAG TPA: serine/threonine-protein kinase, partial [Polyangia bacterium]
MSREAAPAGPVTFGRYTLLERLAVGGMAEVFRAKISSSHGFEKILVIKRILPHLAADPGFVTMFIDEAKLTAQLTHPKIVQILDFGEVNGQYFTALEFIDGFDALGLLRIAAQKKMRVPPALAVFIIDEMLEALDYAHNARDMEGKPMQIVHRDISPSNIFISRRGDVKLGDFGIAHAQRRESKTQAGTLKGKYGYMSPEQVVGRPVDARSDLFAVGILLAELLTGRRLFSAPADLDVLLKVRDVHLDRLDKYGTDIPRALDRILRRALKKDPAERPQTAAELHDDLADYLFSAGKRVGPTDLRAFTGKLLDADP